MSVWNQCAKLLEANGDSSKNCTIHIFCENLEITKACTIIICGKFYMILGQSDVSMRDRYL